MLRSLVTIAASYAIGGVPVAYLTGRLLKGIDIREYGSGNVGPSNVWRHVSKPAVVPVGLAEIGQGALGPALARRWGLGTLAQVLAGLAALIAHNWSPFLNFTGGRGVGHAIGYMLMLSKPALAVFVALSLAGVRLGKVPQLVLLGIVAMPFAARAAGQPREIVAGNAAVAGAIVVKRLLGNDNSRPSPRRLLYRLLYDRDTREREQWVETGAQAGRRASQIISGLESAKAAR